MPDSAREFWRALWRTDPYVVKGELSNIKLLLALGHEIIDHPWLSWLNDANHALAELRAGHFDGAAVLVP
jgi:hypothetical protein